MSTENANETSAVADSKESPRPASVQLSTLLVIGLSLLIGAVGALLLTNAARAEAITFSTIGLATFLFGIGLSSASIVLAIVAISLGKASEGAMIRRSDESIRLQNAVFSRTVEVLGRIESSTGVTERRIEDMISGRAGVISENIAEKLLADRGLKPRTRENLGREIRESLVSQLAQQATTKPVGEGEEIKRQAHNERYRDFKDSVLLGVANLPGVKAIKIGEGGFRGDGIDLVDGLFEIRDSTFSVSTFAQYEDWISDVTNGPLLKSYVRNLAAEISKGAFSRSILAFDRDVNDEPIFATVIEDLRTIAKDEFVSKISVTSGSSKNIIDNIAQRIQPTPA